MDQKVKDILSKLNSPSMMDILKFHGTGDYTYHSYKNNAHSTGVKVQSQELEHFCRMLFIDYRNYVLDLEKNGKLNERWQVVADTLKSSRYNPNEMDRMAGTPFYDFIYKDFNKMFDKSFLNIADIQENGDIAKGKDDFMHVYSYAGSAAQRGKTDVRLYLNLMGKNIIKFSEEFYIRSREKGLPGYFKFFNTDNERNDTWLVYSSYENMDKYVEIIESIKRDRPELLEGTENVSYNMASLNGYIGFGEEPKGIDANGKEKILESDDEKMSYNQRLGNVTTNILGNIRTKTLDNIRGNIPTGRFSKNNDKFGNTDKTFQEYLYEGVIPIIDKYVEPWLKSPKGIEWTKKSKYNDKNALISRCKMSFESEFVKYLTSNGKLPDLKIPGFEGLNIPLNQYNWLGYLKKALPENENFNNNTILRGYLCQYACFKSFNSPENAKLYSGMKSEMDVWIQSALQKDPNNPTIQAIAKELNGQNGKISTVGKALVVIASAGFVSSYNGNEINIRYGDDVLNIAQDINRYNVCEATIGKDNVEKIAREECHRNNVDFNRVCFNETTVKQNNISSTQTNNQTNNQNNSQRPATITVSNAVQQPTSAQSNPKTQSQKSSPNTNNTTSSIVSEEIKKYYEDMYTSFFGEEKDNSVYGKSSSDNKYRFNISEIGRREPNYWGRDYIKNMAPEDQYKNMLSQIESISFYKHRYVFIEENGKKYYMDKDRPDTKQEVTQDIADAFVFAEQWEKYKMKEGIDARQFSDPDYEDWASKETENRFITMMKKIKTSMTQGASIDLSEYSFLNPSDPNTMCSIYRLLGGFLGYDHIPLNLNSNNISYLQANNYFDENGIHHSQKTGEYVYDNSEGM